MEEGNYHKHLSCHIINQLTTNIYLIILNIYLTFFLCRNPELQSSSSAIAESEGIREEDEFDLDESGSSASSGACTVEEAAYGNDTGSPIADV